MGHLPGCSGRGRGGSQDAGVVCGPQRPVRGGNSDIEVKGPGPGLQGLTWLEAWLYQVFDSATWLELDLIWKKEACPPLSLTVGLVSVVKSQEDDTLLLMTDSELGGQPVEGGGPGSGTFGQVNSIFNPPHSCQFVKISINLYFILSIFQSGQNVNPSITLIYQSVNISIHQFFIVNISNCQHLNL